MKRIHLKWKAWCGDEHVTFSLPDSWDVIHCKMNDRSRLTQAEMKQAIQSPLSSNKIAHDAKGDVAIAVEDITRPIELDTVLNVVRDELQQAGIGPEKIKVFVALGGHRPMTRDEMILKLGERAVDELDIYQHNPYENLIDIGKTQLGTPVQINRSFYECDYKIGIGSVLPHPWMGFSGGAKIVLPGLSGIDTLEANHSLTVRGIAGALVKVDNNQVRQDIEEAAHMVSLDFVICCVPNSERELVAVSAGNMIMAHRKAVQIAKTVYATQIVDSPDAVLLNAYPSDSEILQAAKGLNLYHATEGSIVRKGGTIVLVSACVFGRGFSALFNPGGRLHESSKPVAGFMKSNRLIFFSPNLNRFDAAVSFPADVTFTSEWAQVAEQLNKRHAKGGTIAVYPNASLQLPVEEVE